MVDPVSLREYVFTIIQDPADLGTEIIHPIQALASEMDAPRPEEAF